jgi:hypothetical protein
LSSINIIQARLNLWKAFLVVPEGAFPPGKVPDDLLMYAVNADFLVTAATNMRMPGVKSIKSFVALCESGIWTSMT